MQQNTQTPSRRVAIGQGFSGVPEAPKPDLTVRIRSGEQLVTGRLVGDAGQPRAFVWQEEAANDTKRELVICADLEGGWLWEDGKATTVAAAFPENKEVQRLERKFRYWLTFLQENWNAERSQRFFWARFHQEGLALARRLQAMLIGEATVRYWRPAQDPRGNAEREMDL